MTQSRPRLLLRDNFAKAVALIYTAGTVAHVLRLIYRLTWQEMPYFPDWILSILGMIGVAGLVMFAREVDYRGTWERIPHWLIVAHLGVSVVVHIWILAVHSHEVLAVFSFSYSYFAAVYFAFFAWRSWTMRLKPAAASDSGPEGTSG